MKTPSSHHSKHPNYPDERGRGVPHSDTISQEMCEVMDRAWQESEAQEVRARAAADAAYQQYLKNKGGQ